MRAPNNRSRGFRAPDFRAPDFWAGSTRAQRPTAGLLSGLLSPLGALFDLAGRLRRATTRPRAMPLPVICVGNLVAGGAGKTPVVLALLRALAGHDLSVHVLTRGYRGTAAGPLRVDPDLHDAVVVGDEALLLARHAPTWVSRDRPAGAEAALAAGAQLLILDDGFQNPTLAKDLSLLVVDGGFGFGNGRLIPAGPLRETVSRGLARADATVLLGPDATGPGAMGLAERLAAAGPLLRARLVPAGDQSRFAGRTLFAFAGIGRPEKFFDTLASLGAELAACRAFPDHHAYGVGEVDALLAEAARLKALPVTTEKDAVRLPESLREEVAVLPVEIAWQDEAALAALLRPLLAQASEPLGVDG